MCGRFNVTDNLVVRKMMTDLGVPLFDLDKLIFSPDISPVACMLRAQTASPFALRVSLISLSFKSRGGTSQSEIQQSLDARYGESFERKQF